MNLKLLFVLGILATWLGCGHSETLRSARSATTTTCVTLQRGVAGTVNDALINPSSPTKNFGNSGSLTVGQAVGGTPRESLLKFDLSTLPAGQTIVSATATLTTLITFDVQVPTNIHRVTAAWSETGVTWANFGGASSATVEATFPTTTVTSADLTALTQAWYDGTYPNFGVHLERSYTGGATFASSEGSASARPKLVVCYAPAATCTDSTQNGAETDVDCGGGNCPACADTQHCAVDTDCTSHVCAGGTCQSPTCTDGVKNGAETDVDCGGSCSSCGTGLVCAVAADCVSGVCTMGVCQAATCVDGVKNAVETDVDCGGGTCAPCVNTKMCTVSADCTSGLCFASTCYAQGTAGAVTSSCTLPTVGAYTETTPAYGTNPATGWGVLTAPPTGTTVLGAVLLVHGGAWLDGSTGPGAGSPPWPFDDGDTARKFAKLGYVVFDPAYRSVTTAVHPAQAIDVLCAARFLRDTMTGGYPAVPPSMFVMGASAGAHLAAFIAYAPSSLYDDGSCPRSGAVVWRGVLAWSGIYDLTATLTKPSSAAAVQQLLGYAPAMDPTGALAASPYSYVNPTGPDLVVAHGATDPTLPASGTAAFYTQALARGVNATHVLITTSPGGGLHAWPPFSSITAPTGCTFLNFLATH